jgi:thioredoxin reductase
MKLLTVCFLFFLPSFHCLFCHGYEERDAPHSGVLAVGDLANLIPAMHFARNALQITPGKVTVYTNGEEQLAGNLITAFGSESKFAVDSRAIQRLEKGPNNAEVIIHFQDGSSVTEGFMAHKPKSQLKDTLAQQLNLEMTPMGDVKVNPPFYQTSVRGVFAAGDNAGPIKIANNALFAGAAAGAGAAAQLQADNLGHKGMI